MVFAQNVLMKIIFKPMLSFDIFLGAIPGFPVQVLARFVPHPAAGFPLQSRALLAI
jgi:hypothetical protein